MCRNNLDILRFRRIGFTWSDNYFLINFLYTEYNEVSDTKKKMIKDINFLVAWWLDSNQNRNCYYELHTCACMHARYHQRTTKYVTNSIFPKPSIRLVDHRQAAHEFSRGFVIMHRFFFAMSHTISPITCHSFFLQLARCTSVFKSERSESSLQNSAKKGLYRVSQQLLDMNFAKNP